MAAMATMAMLNPKTFTIINSSSKPTILTKPIINNNNSLLSIQNLPKGLKPTQPTNLSSASLAVAGAIFSALSSCEPAFAAQQIAELAEGSSDNRGLALLLPIIPAIAWVLFNILQPALNQINKMRSTKGVIVGLGLGLGGLAASGFMVTPHASAAAAAEAATDNRGQLLLFVVAPAILWVLYNILQPALNQINRMRS